MAGSNSFFAFLFSLAKIFSYNSENLIKSDLSEKLIDDRLSLCYHYVVIMLSIGLLHFTEAVNHVCSMEQLLWKYS